MNPKHQSKPEVAELDLSPLEAYINEVHEGNLLSFTNWLDRAIYMFHYLPEDAFTALERQNTCHILMQLKETLIKVHNQQ